MEAINCKDILGKELYMDDEVVCRYYGGVLAKGKIIHITKGSRIKIKVERDFNTFCLVYIKDSNTKIIKI